MECGGLSSPAARWALKPEAGSGAGAGQTLCVQPGSPTLFKIPTLGPTLVHRVSKSGAASPILGCLEAWAAAKVGWGAAGEESSHQVWPQPAVPELSLWAPQGLQCPHPRLGRRPTWQADAAPGAWSCCTRVLRPGH